jgi:hypothetical protein
MAVVAGSLVASITDTKHLFFIMVKPHVSDYRQLWRCMTWPLVYTNSTEVLFAAMTLYQLRIIERLWGSRKFAVSLPLDTHLQPVTELLCAVIPLVDIALYRSASAPPPYTHHPTALILQHQLSSRRPDSLCLRPPRAVPRRYSLHVQIPTLSHRLVASILVGHQLDLEIYILHSPPPTRVVTTTWFCHRSSSGLASGIRIQKGYPTWSSGVEDTGSECWQEGKREV